MGLFGKRKASAAELATLQGDVCALRNQLVESEEARENMARQLIGVQARFMTLSDSAADKSELEERFEQFDRRLERVAPLTERVDALGGDLGDATARLDLLGGRLDQITGCLEHLPGDHARLQRVEEKFSELPDHGADVDELRGRLTETDRQLAELAGQAAAHAELRRRLAELDARMLATSTSIDEQLADIAGDVDALASLPSNRAAAGESTAIDEIRGGQARLANEQARFQIAVRDDVAALAEQIRRLTGGR